MAPEGYVIVTKLITLPSKSTAGVQRVQTGASYPTELPVYDYEDGPLDYVLTINGLMVVRWHKGMIFQVQHVQDELDVILFVVLQCTFVYFLPVITHLPTTNGIMVVIWYTEMKFQI